MRTGAEWIVAGLVAGLLTMASGVAAAEAPAVSEGEAAHAARTWLEVLQTEGFADAAAAEVAAVRPLEDDGEVVGWIAELVPTGYVLLASSSAFAPVKAFSLGHGFDLEPEGLGAVLRDEMSSERRALAAERGEGAVVGERPHELWRPLLEGRPEAARKSTGSSRVDPLLTARWGQFSPYADFCPDTCGGRSVVGCVATAISQVVHYWRHPAYGFGSHSYLWDGDGCPGYQRELTADFSDPYDWANMRDETFRDSPLAERQAVAELSYEVGVSVESDYGVAGTGALVADAVTALPRYFGYHPSVNRVNRRDLGSDHEWFEVFREQLDLGRPVLLALRGWRDGAPDEVIQHAVVADGYWVSWPSYVHLNLGWSHWYDDWYLLDSIVTGSSHWDILDQQFAVRDVFPDSCVVPPRPAAPAVAATTVATGESYRVGWDAVEGATVFELQEDVDPAFPNPATTRTTGLFHLFHHAVESPTVFYYRLRGSGSCGFNELPSEWSEVRSVTVTPEEDPDPERSFRQLVAGVARIPGAAGADWHSSLTVVNRTAETVDALLNFRSGSGEVSAAVTLTPGQERLWDDVVADLWGLQDAVSGAVEVRSTGPLLVTARTYNRSGAGSYGQFLPGCDEGDTVGVGASATLAPIRGGGSWRTNVGFLNLGESSCRVAVTLHDPEGATRGEVVEVEIAAGAWRQVASLAATAGAGTLDPGYATFEPLEEGCAVWGYASVIDNGTGDPTTIPMTAD